MKYWATLCRALCGPESQYSICEDTEVKKLWSFPGFLFLSILLFSHFRARLKQGKHDSSSSPVSVFLLAQSFITLIFLTESNVIYTHTLLLNGDWEGRTGVFVRIHWGRARIAWVNASEQSQRGTRTFFWSPLTTHLTTLVPPLETCISTIQPVFT